MDDRSLPPASLLEAELELAAPKAAMATIAFPGAAGDRTPGNRAVGGAAGPTTYVGGKNGAGVWQRLISLMPPHREYIEAFLGSGAILRRKRPGSRNVGIDVDAGIIARHGAGGRQSGPTGPSFEFICADAIEWLQQRQDWRGDELIYCDPPYLGTARHWPDRRCYAHEMKGEAEHARLLRILATIPAMIMVSGYACGLYDRALATWRRVEYQAQTRGGLKTEICWLNFPEGQELHDYRFLGRDYRERHRIRKKIKNWQRRLKAMPALERAAVIAGIVEKPKGDGL